MYHTYDKTLISFLFSVSVKVEELLVDMYFSLFSLPKYSKCQAIRSTNANFKHKTGFIRLGRPKAALLFWFFGGFRCGVPLFIVMLLIY